MKKVLILFAHPNFEKSRANKIITAHIQQKEGVTFHDLYEEYPNFMIDVEAEKKLLLAHDVIIWHHPFYWYSCPPLMKQWIDLVLQFNWAYGPKGKKLVGKRCFNVITTGSSKDIYCTEGLHHYSINTFLRPFEQTARLCGMEYLQPFAVMGTLSLSEEDLSNYAQRYEDLIDLLHDDLPITIEKDCAYLNDIPELNN